MSCDHKFIDSTRCLKCGQGFDAISEGKTALRRALDDAESALQRQKLEIAKLRNALDDAVGLLRDWEDYDPDDPGCGWVVRRDEFLAEHEEAGR